MNNKIEINIKALMSNALLMILKIMGLNIMIMP